MISKEELLQKGLNVQVELLHQEITELEKKILALQPEGDTSVKGNKRRITK